MAPPARLMQRLRPEVVTEAGVSTSSQEHPHRLGVPVCACQVQGCAAIVVCAVRVEALLEQLQASRSAAMRSLSLCLLFHMPCVCAHCQTYFRVFCIIQLTMPTNAQGLCTGCKYIRCARMD